MSRKVRKEFVKEARKRLEEEKDWPELIEADRLEAAFEDLRRAGIVAEMGATDTLSGGWTWLRAEDVIVYDLAELRSYSLEELTVQFWSDDEAREAQPDLVEHVKGRFPRLRTFTVKGLDSFEETVYLGG